MQVQRSENPSSVPQTQYPVLGGPRPLFFTLRQASPTRPNPFPFTPLSKTSIPSRWRRQTVQKKERSPTQRETGDITGYVHQLLDVMVLILRRFGTQDKPANLLMIRPSFRHSCVCFSFFLSPSMTSPIPVPVGNRSVLATVVNASQM